MKRNQDDVVSPEFVEEVWNSIGSSPQKDQSRDAYKIWLALRLLNEAGRIKWTKEKGWRTSS